MNGEERKGKGGEEEERKSGGEGEVIQRRASPLVSSSTHPPFPTPLLLLR